MNILRIIILKIKMNSLWFQNIPIELRTVISSYLTCYDFINFIELVNIDYVQVFIINFREYYNKNLNHDHAKVIYKDLLFLLYLLHEYNRSEERSNIMELLNLKLRENPYTVNRYNFEAITYLMENEYIDINIPVIAILDNLGLFKKFNSQINSYYEFISNGSYKILELILKDDIKRSSWLKHDDINDSGMNIVVEDIKHSYRNRDIDITIIELICKYIQFTNIEYKLILSSIKDGNIESYRYLVSKITDMEGYFIHEILEDIIQFNSFDMFQLIYNKFSNKLTGDDISSLYFNLLESNLNGLSNNKIKIFKLLSSHSAVKNKFKSKYKDDEKVVDVR